MGHAAGGNALPEPSLRCGPGTSAPLFAGWQQTFLSKRICRSELVLSTAIRYSSPMREPSPIPNLIRQIQALAPAGFAIAMHLRFTAANYMFETYPAAWLEEYAQNGFLMRDPTIRWGSNHQGTIAWSELAADDDAGLFARAAEHGLRHGLTVSLQRGGSRSIGGLARADRPFTAEEHAALEARMSELHDATASGEPLPPSVAVEFGRMGVHFTQR